MSILPKGGLPQNQPVEISKPQPNRTYRLDLIRGRVAGMMDDIEAVKQAVYKILSTRRGEHQIYGYDYGIDLNGLIGSNRAIIQSKIKQRIRDALLYDDRITGVENFNFTFEGDEVNVEFTVVSVLGNFRSSYSIQQ